MEYSVAMTEMVNKELQEFLLKDIHDEEICFAIWYPVNGKIRFSGLIHTIVFPKDGDRKRHGNVSAYPQYLDRVKRMAIKKKGGIAMIHTHPLGEGPQNVSKPDLYYEQKILAREIFGITGLPLLGMTLSGDGIWSARFYPKPFGIEWCHAVRIVGKTLKMHYNPMLQPAPIPNEKQVRTTSIWKETIQSELMRLHVGVIGVGSVGAAVAEILSKIGVGKITIMDYDNIKIHNLDRIPNTGENDIGKSKINIVNRNLQNSATTNDFSCIASSNSIVEESGFREALDCDMLFSCVDRPWPRQVMNHLAYSCLIPVIDGGITFKISKNKLIHGMYRAQTIGPERPCLDCLGALDPTQIQMDRQGLFDDPDYISQLEKSGKQIESRQNIMPFVFSLAGLETIQFVELFTNLGKMGDLGQQSYNYFSGMITTKKLKCKKQCKYMKKTAQGDSDKPILGLDKSRKREITNYD